MAGSPCPIEVMKKVSLAMNMREVTICYGMTETSPVSTQTAPRTRSRSALAPWGAFTRYVEV
jgi:acyl-CoA synthetase (AMP-forming)/AMP-acid ligase II